MSITKTINYDLKCLNSIDYEIALSFSVENRIMRYIFDQAKKKILKEKKVSLEYIEAFDIDTHYHRTLLNMISKLLRQIQAECRADGIKLVSEHIKSGKFKRVGDSWHVEIIVAGDYTR